MNPDLNVSVLVAALHEHAAGLFADTAAVDLIARHDMWLHRSCFHPFIHIGHCRATGTPIAHIRWRAARTALERGQLPCSDSEADILRIAASLAAGTPIRLRQVLGGFDRRNAGLIANAITLANGYHPLEIHP